MSENILPNQSRSNVYGPLTAVQMFERTFALLRENFKLFFGIVLVVIAVELVVGGVMGSSGILMAHAASGRAAIMRFLFLAPLYLLGFILTYVFTQVVQGALFLAARARLANASIKVGVAWKLALEQAGRLIGISILVFLRSVGYMLLFWLVLGIPFGVVLLISGLAHGGGAAALRLGHGASPVFAVLLVLFMLVFFVLYICAFLWLAARYALSIPAALAENLPITEAIRRSIHLTRGSKGRLYALYVGVFAIYLVIAAFTLPIQLLILHRAGAHLAHAAGTFSAALVALNIFEYFVGAIVLAMIGVGAALCYFDLRVRKEGFDGESAVPALEHPFAPPTSPGEWPIEDLPIS